MNFCPVPDPTIGYLSSSFVTGIGPDLQAVCPAIPVSRGVLHLVVDFLRRFEFHKHIRLSDITHAITSLFGVLATMLTAISAPVLWVLGACFWVLSAVFSAVFSVVSVILRVVLSPLLVPWYAAVWCWDTFLAVYDELEPLIAYFSFAILLGVVSGTFIAILTTVLANLLDSWFPWLPQPRHRHRRTRSRAQSESRQQQHQTQQQQARRHSYGGEGRTTTTTKTHRNSPSPSYNNDSRHIEMAIYSTDSDSDSGVGSFGSSSRYAMMTPAVVAAGGGASSSSASASMAKTTSTSRRRTPLTVGVRVGDTIHEESSSG
ncbi:hypothetical protein C8A00DRAFT_30663 [Chaetomidium leptoderma]|uniref:Uncharacterized protein n=1 Tax=Chaetomidium leptoderma TaxID=669021 RepID=A0AAN6VSK7_9PEZI|nr:hypothetical protein C8A00DRAFT_30663 [Chaetomidium leptoderma]